MLLANINGKEHLRHRAVSLRQRGFLVVYALMFYEVYFIAVRRAVSCMQTVGYCKFVTSRPLSGLSLFLCVCEVRVAWPNGGSLFRTMTRTFELKHILGFHQTAGDGICKIWDFVRIQCMQLSLHLYLAGMHEGYPFIQCSPVWWYHCAKCSILNPVDCINVSETSLPSTSRDLIGRQPCSARISLGLTTVQAYTCPHSVFAIIIGLVVFLLGYTDTKLASIMIRQVQWQQIG